MKKIISNKIIEELKDLNIESVEILKVKNSNFGEYQTNLALKNAKRFKKSPQIFGEEIAKRLLNIEIFDYVSVIPSGFLVFQLNKDFFKNESLKFMDRNFKPIIGLKGKINYEFISANPTGLLHIGHARNAIVGDAFTRIAEFAGYSVVREYYINDAGNQINDLALSVKMAIDLKQGNITKEEYADAPYKGQEIREFSEKLIEEKRNNVSHIELKEISLQHFLTEIKKTLDKIGIKPIEKWTSEKELFTSGKVNNILNKIRETDYWFKKENAYWIKTTDFKDDKDRVLIKSNGNYTYLVADIANHVSKFKQGYDVLYDLFGKDHHGYEQRVRASLSILNYDEKKLNVDFIAMVKILKNGDEFKMSKRNGTSLTINKLVELTDIEAFKFALLERNKEQDLVIDINDFEKQRIDNSYLLAQYAHARATRIIYKYTEKFGKLPVLKKTKLEWTKISNKLAKVIVDFSDRIDSALNKREPSEIVSYIKELAKCFNSFYNNIPVIVEDEKTSRENIKLVMSFKNVISLSFDLIGIKAKEKM